MAWVCVNSFGTELIFETEPHKLHIAGETIMVLANAQKYRKVLSRNSSEENCLGKMNQQNLKENRL